MNRHSQYLLEEELSEDNPLVNLLRSRTAAAIMLFVSLLYPIEAFSATATCQNVTMLCLDSTPCKMVNGVEICLAGVTPLPFGALQSNQTCWQAQGTYNCVDNTSTRDTCGPYKTNPQCGIIGTTCAQTDPTTGACLANNNTYQCQTGGGVSSTQTDCSGQNYCSGGVCYTKKDQPNNALPKVITAMEVARQAGFYFDPSTLTIFKGDSAWCTENSLGLANCCKPDTRGMGSTNAIIVDQLILHGWNAWVKKDVGSNYSFDALYDQATGYVDQAINGMKEVLGIKESAGYVAPVTGTTSTTSNSVPAANQPTGAGVGGMIGGTIGTTVGSSLVANNGGNTIWTGIGGAAGYAAGTAAGSYVGAYAYGYGAAVYANGVGAIGSGTAAAGGTANTVGAICTPCIVAMVIVMVIMALLACDIPEIKTQMKLGAKLCHEVGVYCSASDGLGQCLTVRHEHCCFNSKLARIVNEQGRPQIGKAWGTAQTPDCTGYTSAQLQSLDFSKMDLSEFFADVQAQANIDATKISNDIQNRIGNYYASTPTSSMNGVIPPPTAGSPIIPAVTNSSPPSVAMPACNIALVKQAPANSGDQTGTFTITNCLPGGSVTWNYTGSCTSMQGATPPIIPLDANGGGTWTTAVLSACLTPSTPKISNTWKVMVVDPNAGLIGSVQAQW